MVQALLLKLYQNNLKGRGCWRDIGLWTLLWKKRWKTSMPFQLRKLWPQSSGNNSKSLRTLKLQLKHVFQQIRCQFKTVDLVADKHYSVVLCAPSSGWSKFTLLHSTFLPHFWFLCFYQVHNLFISRVNRKLHSSYSLHSYNKIFLVFCNLVNCYAK